MTLDLTVRYFQDSTPEGIPVREENFERREIPMSFPIDQTALVLVDLWNDHFIDSWIGSIATTDLISTITSLATKRSTRWPLITRPL